MWEGGRWEVVLWVDQAGEGAEDIVCSNMEALYLFVRKIVFVLSENKKTCN